MASARASAASAPACVRSRVAANPHPPPMRARTPMPSEPVAATSSMRPPTTARSSPSVATQRASA
jgi:hypothetical protein